MKEPIAAAKLSARLPDLSKQRDTRFFDLGGETLPEDVLTHFERAGLGDTLRVACRPKSILRTQRHRRQPLVGEPASPRPPLPKSARATG
jgi:hypothetical protein